MAIIKKPEPGQLKVDRLRNLYLSTEQKIIKEITRKRNLGLVDYGEVAALERVQKILTDMQDEANEYVPSMIKQQFYTRNDLPSAPQGYENALALTSTQTGIVERLIDNLMYDINAASETAYKSAENFLTLGRTEADRFRMLTLEEVAKLEAEGKGWNTIQRQMAAKLEAKGITSFVDKAGRQWGLTQYCSMATRTTQRQAQVAAALTEDDWDLWQISKIGSTCPLCSVYEGRVYSKSGTDPDYPPLTMAFGKIDPSGINDLSNTYLNIHPNCLHTLMRYTTAGKTPEQVQRDKDFSSFEKRPANEDYRSKKQINAYRQKENARAEYRRNMKQFKEYQAALGKDFPKTFETFEKHKKLNDDVYKGWEKKFRELGKKASDIMKVEQSAQPYTIQTANKKLSSVLEKNYNSNIDRNKLHLVKSKNSEFASANFEGLSEKTAQSFDTTLSSLISDYETPLNKVSVMSKEEGFMRKTVPASTAHNYNTATAEMEINPVRLKDYDQYIDSVSNAVQKGQFPKIKPENYEKYVPTHEFAHSMATIGEKLPGKSANWAEMDYSNIKSARKEIDALYADYVKEVNALDAEKKALYDKFFNGDMTVVERIKEVEATEKQIKISKYSLENSDEFWAEAFADAKLGENPGKYAKQAEAIADKYFKRR